jgi:two-component system sensor histidine kinase AlgZ
LQARIHPHFLFNTLNTIASLIRNHPENAEQAVLDLADLLRSALTQRDTLTLNEELELTRRYLAIESLRLGDRLQVDWRLDSDLPLDLPIPALLLQPLVENAIQHGVQCLSEGGTLTIQLEKRATALRITVINPQPASLDDRHESGQRMAQDNIRQRLQLAYETLDPLVISETPDRYQVTLTLPLARSPDRL